MCSGSNCSENFPAKCMRWSVAMEPVTAMGTVVVLARCEGRFRPQRREPEQPTGRCTGSIARRDAGTQPDSTQPRPEGPDAAGGRSVGLAERVAAGAGTLRVGVVDG